MIGVGIKFACEHLFIIIKFWVHFAFMFPVPMPAWVHNFIPVHLVK